MLWADGYGFVFPRDGVEPTRSSAPSPPEVCEVNEVFERNGSLASWCER